MTGTADPGPRRGGRARGRTRPHPGRHPTPDERRATGERKAPGQCPGPFPVYQLRVTPCGAPTVPPNSTRQATHDTREKDPGPMPGAVPTYQPGVCPADPPIIAGGDRRHTTVTPTDSGCVSASPASQRSSPTPQPSAATGRQATTCTLTRFGV